MGSGSFFLLGSDGGAARVGQVLGLGCLWLQSGFFCIILEIDVWNEWISDRLESLFAS